MIQEIGNLASGEHYLSLMLIVIFSCVLTQRNVISDRVRKTCFAITVAVCALLLIQDIAENYAQLDPSRKALRTLTSIAGYSLRPAAVLGFVLVIWPPKKKSWFLWIPAVLNALLYCTALISPLTFSFDSNYHFRRGPLGWASFPVSLVYLAAVMVTIHLRFRDRRSGDIFVLYLCAVGCLGAMATDVYYGGVAIVCAILISCMVFYIFLRAQDTDHDPLTRLWNRLVFYEDCQKLRNTVTAVASIDMNGLKRTNDELGHAAGDRALKTIAKGLHSVTNRKVSAYRIGGDEFILFFARCTENEIQQAISDFQNEMWRVGLSVSIGYAIRTDENEPIDELLRISDMRMFEDKRMYYQLHDRRKPRQS